MEIVGAIVTFLLTIATLIATVWTMAGAPLGIVLVVLKSNKKIQMSGKKILLLSFGGPILLVVNFALFFVLSTVLAFFGISLTNLTLPR